MVLLMFLFFGAFFIISNQNLHLNNEQESAKFWNSYYTWASKLFDNGKSVVGYVVKSDWMPADKIINNSSTKQK
jgi:hypothetical protein